MTCKLQSFLIEVCYTASMMTLVLISYERRKAVVEPLHARVMVQDGTRRKIISAWVVSLLVDLPLLYAHDVEQDDSGVISCDNMVLRDLLLYSRCFLFLLPLAYMVYAQIIIFRKLGSKVFPRQNAFTTSCSNRGMHRKVAKTLAALTFAFVMCWSPFIVVRTLTYLAICQVRAMYGECRKL